MKKYILGLTVGLVFVFYSVFQQKQTHALPALNVSDNPGSTIALNSNDDSPVTTPIINTPSPTNSTPPPAVPPSPAPVNTTPQPTPTAAPIPKPVGQYKDGTYTGNSADAYYGYVQVKVTISGGKISNVKFLDYPSDRSTSREISSFAIPQLTSEAIAAQNANVDIVSGATDTSLAFRQSLGSALAQAKN